MRTKEILRELLIKDKTAKELALDLQVSDRTIRDDIKKINNELSDKLARIESSNNGYSLKIEDYSSFMLFLDDLSNEVYQAYDQLVFQILYILLVTDKAVKIDSLSEILFASRSSTERYLKDVKIILSKNNLSLKARPNHGIQIVGESNNRRKLLAELIMSDATPLDHLLHSNDFKVIQHRHQKIVNEVFSVLKEEDYRLSESSLESLVLHIEVLYLTKDEPMNFEYHNIDELAVEMKIAEKIIHRLQDFSLDELENDIVYIASQLQARKKYDEVINEANPLVSSDINRIIDRILSACLNRYNVDLRDNFDLRMNLSLHMIPLISRIRYQIRMKNPLVKQTKSTNPLAFQLAVEASSIIKEEFGVILNESELGYLAIYFSMAINRNEKREKRNILIICSSGRATSELLAYKIKSSFEEHLNQVETVGLHDLDHMDLEKFDYILTTVPISRSLGKPIIQISCLLESYEMKMIETSILHDENALHFYDCTDENLFNVFDTYKNKEDLIHTICEQAAKYVGIDHQYEKDVLQRDALYSTAIGNKVAIPHSSNSHTDQTFVSVTVLKQPILWGENYVQVVVMLGLGKDPKYDMQVFYEEFTNFVTDEKKIMKLIQNPTFEQLSILLRRIYR